MGGYLVYSMIAQFTSHLVIFLSFRFLVRRARLSIHLGRHHAGSNPEDTMTVKVKLGSFSAPIWTCASDFSVMQDVDFLLVPAMCLVAIRP